MCDRNYANKQYTRDQYVILRLISNKMHCKFLNTNRHCFVRFTQKTNEIVAFKNTIIIINTIFIIYLSYLL